jgi:hypothetical protein
MANRPYKCSICKSGVAGAAETTVLTEHLHSPLQCPAAVVGWAPCALTQDFRGSVVSYFVSVVVTYGVYYYTSYINN